jgi:hypothetical protein
MLDKQILERKERWLEHQLWMPSERASIQLSYYQQTGICHPEGYKEYG